MIFAQAAARLRQEFGELVTVPHNALRGGEAERIVRRFLNDHLPKRFMAGAGFVLDKKQSVSPQTDVVVYDALNCPVYRASEEAAIFPADNVAAVIEVKSRLDSSELRSAFLKTQTTKGLAKTPAPKLPLPLPVQTQTLGCLFAFSSDINLETVANTYADLLREHGIGLHLDMIAVLDVGVVTLASKMPKTPGWSSSFIESVGGRHAEGAHFGVSALKLGADTLDGFMRLLLPQLAFFRGMVDHPGFRWQDTAAGGQAYVQYVWSHTNEKDPRRKKAKLDQYARDVLREFTPPSASGDTQ